VSNAAPTQSATALWAGRRDARKVAAKAKLARMQTSSTGHGVAHPFPVADKDVYKAKHTNEEINGAIDKAPIKDVPLAKIHAIQYSVKPGRVLTFIDRPDAVPPGYHDPEHGGIVDEPVVIKQDGKMYLHDGHHRATAAALMGDKTVKARLVDFDR
jgi:hypothetical protein